jgi:aspartyl-tRNA(Asn)/glutamyl-tRNA(Gln) amidotransferase subunit A|nr:hypothetical protein [Brevibacillus massiliensis]
MDVLTLSQSIREKKLSPVEVVRQMLADVQKQNPLYNAYVTVCEEEALPPLPGRRRRSPEDTSGT